MKLKPIKPLPERQEKGPGGLSLPNWLWNPAIQQFLEQYRAALIAGMVVTAVMGVFMLLYVRHQSMVSERSSQIFIGASNIYNYRIPEEASETVPMVSTDEEKYMKAGQAFQQLVDTYPGSDLAPYALYYAANCRYRLKQFGPALEAYGQFVARYPKHDLVSQAHLGAGDAQEQLGKYDEALESYKRVIEDDSPVAYEGALGAVRCLLKISETDRGRWNEAVGILGKLASEEGTHGARRSRGLRKLLMDLQGGVSGEAGARE